MKTKHYVILFLIFINLLSMGLLINKTAIYQKTREETIHILYDSELKQIEYGE